MGHLLQLEETAHNRVHHYYYYQHICETGEDVGAAERATSLCSACDISAKALYVLPQTDHLLGFAIRSGSFFFSFSSSSLSCSVQLQHYEDSDTFSACWVISVFS